MQWDLIDVERGAKRDFFLGRTFARSTWISGLNGFHHYSKGGSGKYFYF